MEDDKKKEKKHKKRADPNKEKDRLAESTEVAERIDGLQRSEQPLNAASTTAITPLPQRQLRVFKSKNLLVAADATRFVEITFEDVNYSVTVKKGSSIPLCGGEKETRHILKDVNGAFRPGTFTAIMGASGAGKVRSILAFLANVTPTSDLTLKLDRQSR